MTQLPPELKAKIDAITPKLTFLNCVAAISKMAQWGAGKEWEDMVAQLNAMVGRPDDRQFYYAELWEKQNFTSTRDFVKWLETQPYFGNL